MRLLSIILIYALCLAPLAAVANYVGGIASAQITGTFEQVLKALKTINASL